MKALKSIIYLSALLISSFNTFAGPGDTTEVQFFTFGSPRNKIVNFPSDTTSFEKVLMYYTLKCNPAQSPACGEWDYLTYTYLYDHTGVLDSTEHQQSVYMVKGQSPDTLRLMNNPGWSYEGKFQYSNSSLMTDSALIGSGNYSQNMPLSASSDDARAQYIYKASALSSAGLYYGNFTALRLFLNNTNNLNNLTIRIKNTSIDSITSNIPIESGFFKVFEQNINFSQSGWHTLNFAWPFIWDGVSNILVDFSFKGNQNFAANMIKSDSMSFACSLSSDEQDNLLKFDDNDYIQVSADKLASQLDSIITISFWYNGDASLPQNTVAIFAADSNNRKVFNVHLPWGNGNIYWDAGNSGTTSYDRIYKAAPSKGFYAENWNFWTFTKNAKTGSMKIYRNGILWHSATGRTRLMNNIKTFYIASNTGQGRTTRAMIDEVSVWNKELSVNEILSIMHSKIDNGANNLLYYFDFNEGIGQTTQNLTDSINANLYGYPKWKSYDGIDRMKNFKISHYRPTIVFEEGTYNPANLDSTFIVDSTQTQPVLVVVYGDTIHPNTNKPTDSLIKYEAYYRYLWDSLGVVYDSILVAADTTLINSFHPWWEPPFEVIDRYELGRFITPYGNGLDLGDGFTWVYDVTDFLPLLHDSVHITAGNWQELLDLKFLMIEGTPARDIKNVQNIYKGRYIYKDATIENKLNAKKLAVQSGTKGLNFKITNTGHGMGGNLNCSEFCPRTNSIFVNNQLFTTEYMWRDNCDMNPLYPQGGTWIYSRANWCPGSNVGSYDYDLSQFLPTDSITIDYNMQSYTWNGQGSQPNYIIEGYLIEYGDINFNLNPSILDIIAPNNAKLHSRYNPTAERPIITIRNDGKDTLTSLDVDYKVGNGNWQTYHWTGSLAFGASKNITLNAIDWTSWDRVKLFTAKLKNPNGTTDDYPYNNEMAVPFDVPDVYPSTIIIWLKTNSQAYQNTINIEDKDGNIVWTKGGFSNNTYYKDTVTLPYGAYRLRLMDTGGNGLKFWANMPPYGTQTSGFLRVRNMSGKYIAVPESDFGRELAFSFTVGYNLSVENPGTPDDMVNLYPNPTKGSFNLALGLVKAQDMNVIFSDVNGRVIFVDHKTNIKNETLKYNLNNYPKGIYMVSIRLENSVITKKVIIN